MSDLIEFIEARLAEDERKANAELAFARHETVIASRDRRRTPGKVPSAIQEIDDRATRMLREVAAKRAIIGMFTGAAEWSGELRAEGKHAQAEAYERVAGTALDAVRELAGVYRGHPGWREEWAADVR